MSSETLLLAGIAFFVVLLAVLTWLLLSIRSSMQNIYKQLHELDENIRQVPFPEYNIVNLEKFTHKLKQILLGLKSINPGRK